MLTMPENNGPIEGPDGLLRTPWAYTNSRMLNYYDTEWGMPVLTEQGLFERVTLEAFQSGLSWDIILRKREDFRRVFHGFDVDAVAAMSDDEQNALLHDASIIRNRAKILATVKNARATIALRDSDQFAPISTPVGTTEPGLPALIWSFLTDETPVPEALDQVPTTSDASRDLAKTLKKNGFSFVGPTTAYALMEAIGIVDTHVVGSWRRGCSGIFPHR